MTTEPFLILSDDKKSAAGFIVSGGKTVKCRYYPLFSLQLRAFDGSTVVRDAFCAEKVETCYGETGLTLIYSGVYDGITVRVHIGLEENVSKWRAEVCNDTDFAVEFVDFPNIKIAETVQKGRVRYCIPITRAV